MVIVVVSSRYVGQKIFGNSPKNLALISFYYKSYTLLGGTCPKGTVATVLVLVVVLRKVQNSTVNTHTVRKRSQRFLKAVN